MTPQEMQLAGMFELWADAIVRTARKDHRCDNITASNKCKYDIKMGEDYFDSGEIDIDHGHYRAVIKYCFQCMTKPMGENWKPKTNEVK